ncbi:MAG: zinc-binding dehydrogenase, partial [Rhodobacteraceae bacterium]|nr:zinc-binding dehydrogenase [Paracoccaceae bacterium]
EGQKVLVTGGAGTVSRYAIQMAKLGGAEVVTTVSSQAKADYARAAGADHVVNYKSDDVAEQVLDLTGGIDRIIELEFGANLPVSEAMINPNGVIAAYGSAGDMTPTLPFYPLMFKGVTLRMILVYILSKQARAETIAGLSRLLEQGVLTHSVAATFPLEDAVKAHEAVEAADKMGSVVVTI